MAVGAVIFDLDGTLTTPYLDFDAIRSELGISGPVLEAIAEMDASARERVNSVLLRHEREAARNATLRDGALELIADLRARQHPIAILTRNSRDTVDLVLSRFGIAVDAVRTRDDGAIKPSGEPVFALCNALGVATCQSWMVGDFLFDVLAGRAAGARTVLLVEEGPLPEYAGQADHVIRQLPELIAVMDGV